MGGYDYYEEKKASIESARKYARELAQEQQKQNTPAAEAAGGSAAQRANRALLDGLHDAEKASGLVGNDGAGKSLTAAQERELKKKKQAEERRLAREKQKCEERIQELEAEIAALQEEMCQPAVLSDSRRLTELDEQVKADQEELEYVYDQWMELE